MVRDYEGRPIEAGINVNKRIREADIFFVGINKYNFDLTMSLGLHYRMSPWGMVGINGRYVRYLTEYQSKEIVFGTYLPVQLGLEAVCLFEF